MTQNANITVTIPVLHNWNYTKECLESLFETSTLVNEIIVIDNDKYGDTAKLLIDDWDVSVYAPGKNLGVAISWDTGIKMANNNIVAVVNNDIKMLTKDWDKVLLEQWSHYPDAFAFCPWPSGSANEKLNPENQPYSGLNGSFFVVDRERLRLTDNYKLKGQYIDHLYEQAYWEDADLLVQIREAGGDAYVTPKVQTVHYSNKTAGPLLPSDKGMHNPYWRNLDYFNKKYGVMIWDYFKVFMSNVQDENTNERLIS